MSININGDMGESFGLYKMGDDEELMPLVSEANVACGYHGSDPNHMRATVRLAKKHGVKVGAHFSLPDLAGFGRREMKIGREELFNQALYQIGALREFLAYEGMEMNHLKPHGALYGMASKEEHVAQAMADAAEHCGLPIFGLSGTLHEKVYKDRGLDFVPEYFADLEYDKSGKLLITAKHESVDPTKAAERCVRAIKEGKVESVEGDDVDIEVSTICVHSDTPNAVAVAKAVREAVTPFMD